MKDNQRLLEFLRCELKAIENGKYASSEKQPWRARLVFEDSPCCPNYENKGPRVPCDQCVLMDLVPADRRHEKVPCRFIPLNSKGDTVDSLYRSGTQQELEKTMAEWLCRTIDEIETEEQTAAGLRHQLPPFKQAKELGR